MRFAFLLCLFAFLAIHLQAQVNGHATIAHPLQIVKPQFPGCLDSFIRHHSRYPETAREDNIQGRVTVSFMVTETGDITDIQYIRSSDNKSLDREALRIIRKMPRWQPGHYKKRPIRMVYILPFTFRFSN